MTDPIIQTCRRCHRESAGSVALTTCPRCGSSDLGEFDDRPGTYGPRNLHTFYTDPDGVVQRGPDRGLRCPVQGCRAELVRNRHGRRTCPTHGRVDV